MTSALLINNNMDAITNKYTKWYYQLIDNARTRIIPKDVYQERHHIVPRSLGGKNCKNNIVNLLPREHFIAHLLLTKMFSGQEKFKMWKAYNMMLTENTVDQTRYVPNSRFYELARKLVGAASSNCNKGRVPWNKGITHSDETKQKISTINKGNIAWNKGINRSDIDRQHMKDGWSKKLKNGFVPHNKGKAQVTTRCENCNTLIAGLGNYTRWHGKNCRKNNNNGS
jgi:hypothetical protein